MFESLSHFTLQQYWWCIMSLLGALLVFLMFVQGGQTLIHRLGKNDIEQKMIINSLGRKWEITFTTLVVFGGAFFASFPLFYATSFGGAYWVWMIILFAFIVQAVSYQFRTKKGNVYGNKFYETMLFINGLVGTVLIGTAVATFFTGSEFVLDEVHKTVEWKGPAYGLEAVLNPLNPILGLAVFFLARVLAILFFMNAIDSENIFRRAKKRLLPETVLFLVFFLTFLIWIMMKDGFAVNPDTGEVFMEPNKYFNNLIEMPINAIIMLVGVVLVLYGIIISIIKNTRKGIWFTGAGTILTVFALFIIAGFNNTAFYPSTYDLQSSLTIRNASSSQFTLSVMGYVSLMVPIVVLYTWWGWKALTTDKITEEEMKNDSHAY